MLPCDRRAAGSTFAFISDHPNIRWNIRDVPQLPAPRTRLADIIEDLPDHDPHWWGEERADYFMNQMSPKHEKQARQMTAGKLFTYATAFRRVRHEKSMAELRTDGIAGCLRTPRGEVAGKSCSKRVGASTKFAYLRPASAQGSKACPTLMSLTCP